jgi:lipid A disaccharide synthetase
VLLIAGEASGDLHGADLVRALRAEIPDLEVFGIGGECLREAGMETVADSSDVATVGVSEWRAASACCCAPTAPWCAVCGTIPPICAC